MDKTHYFESPLGWMKITASSTALKQLQFVAQLEHTFLS